MLFGASDFVRFCGFVERKNHQIEGYRLPAEKAVDAEVVDEAEKPEWDF